MTEIPSWWLAVSGVFFVVNIFLFAAIFVAVLKLVKITQELAPKVNALVDRVEKVAERVEEVAESAKGTVDAVGGRV